MNIWIDGYEANVPQRVGSGQVGFELLKNLEKIDHKNNYTVFLPTPPLEDLPAEREGWTYRILKPRRLWTRIALPLALFTARQKPDVFFTPTHYVPRFTSVKRVSTVFDLSYLHFTQMFTKKDLWQLTTWTRQSVEQSAAVITISESSKDDIVEHYKVKRSKVTVAYPGYDHTVFRPISDKSKIEEIQKKYKISGDYIVFIGTIQPRKNLIRLIEAMAKIDNLKLVVIGKTTGEGKQGWMYDQILRRPGELGIDDRVIFAGFVPTEDMPYLLNGAKAFACPSLWEGFGIPAVEAMACGTPVVVSNVSSLPEIVGNAGLLVDPKSVDQIAQAITTIAYDKKLWAQKSKQGLEQAQKYSWEKMAKTVLKVLESQ